MPPQDTILLESTVKIQKEDVTQVGCPADIYIFISKQSLYSRSFIDFQIWDFPGQVNFFDGSAYDAKEIFDTVGSLVFVIDAQDDYSDALHRLQYTIIKAYEVNPVITFEILIHKVDGLSDDYKDGKQLFCVCYKWLGWKRYIDFFFFYKQTSP